MIGTLSLAERDLAELLAGGGSAQALELLRMAQFSRHLVMLRGVLDLAQDRAPEDATRAGLLESYQVLSDLDEARPGRLLPVLCYPYVGEWASVCLRRLQRADNATGLPLWLDLAHLGAIAAAAAIVLDMPIEVTVPVRDGLIALPALGSLVVSGVARWGLVCLRRGDAGNIQVQDSTTNSPMVCLAPGDAEWLPLRRLKVVEQGMTLDLLLDDADPYRDCHGAGATGRLSENEVVGREAGVASAWRLLVTRHGEQASAIAAGLRVLTPLRARPSGAAVSTTSRAAAGAVAVTPMRQPIRLACALLHEFEHSKLNSVLGLVDLVKAGRGRRFYSPWRDDPRPVVGLLHGVYAWLAVAGFWRVEARAAPQNPILAFESARSEAQLRVGSAALAATGLMTDAGHAVVAAAGSAVRSWRAADCASASADRIRQLAKDLVLDHQLRWKLRNLEVPGWVVARLSVRWRAGRDAAPVPRYDAVVRAIPPPLGISDPRLQRAVQILEDAPATPRTPPSEVEADPDLALILGDYEAAARGYEQLIVNGLGGDVQAWAGLEVARAADRHAGTAPQPELLRALYIALSSDARDEVPSPARLASWLDADEAR
ncbi:MAG: aKG-HExxH-type peptide beta-hydroxylase [Streptosporangiaceae bacterium]